MGPVWQEPGGLRDKFSRVGLLLMGASGSLPHPASLRPRPLEPSSVPLDCSFSVAPQLGAPSALGTEGYTLQLSNSIALGLYGRI